MGIFDSCGRARGPRPTRHRLGLLLAAAAALPLALLTTSFGQDAPRRADLPASLWFGMKYAVIRPRLEEQGAKITKPKPSDERFKGGKTADVEGLMILERKAKSGSAWFQGDSLVGLELSFKVNFEHPMLAWTDSVKAALERKYGPPVHSDFLPGNMWDLGNANQREAVWSISDSEIRFMLKGPSATWRLLYPNRSGSLTAHLSYGIPPYRRGELPIGQEP